MECTKVLFVFLLQSTAVFSTEENSISSRSSYFEIRENRQLQGYVAKRLDSPSLLSCGRLCLENAWCTSTNYKMPSKKDGKGTCELNKHDISLVNENTNFHDQRGVTFSMLLKVISMMKFWIWTRVYQTGHDLFFARQIISVKRWLRFMQLRKVITSLGLSLNASLNHSQGFQLILFLYFMYFSY